MKPLRPLFFIALLCAPLSAQEAASSPQEMMQRLFDPQASKAQFEEAAKKAGMAGIARQQIIEARLVWGLRNQDASWLEKMLPELEVLASNFDAAQSSGFKSAGEIRSFISYTKALIAQSQKDNDAFKTNILEAVWLNPGQAQLFTQVIEKQRMEAKMANMKVDLNLVVNTHDGEATTLADQLGDKKALLLDFWASWCGPCMQLMPELKKKADLLSKHGIVVAGMNKDDQNAPAVTAKVREEQDITFPWLIEPAERPFTKLLEIESIPRMILIAPGGQVLFNGHPQDPALWIALQKVNPEIKAP
ncbi:TlpA family protein disulfide reductase [Prosthecobacter dejongeii]|uniref:Thiol-disulfide isomerase/thioredoxin n=1 Tax=Prosthecobacter dejongeii TaxID=48465 RepID=A0A7W7YPT1_9BACT|nr:TlpA disulfide reductase family protein [Prosthecobacter dejongeii]MBB5040106.1 thiol-disulfide isomerase/thioredoxin [Prosthecobacter dejongeii]